MTEWWTYRPSDFLMFSPRVYWRLFEDLNRGAWPWALLVVLGGAAGWWRATRLGAPRLLLAVLVPAWLGVALLYLRERFAPINWAIEWLWPLFALQALLLAAWCAVAPATSRAVGTPPAPRRRQAAHLLVGWSLLLHPLLPLLQGRPLNQAELPGLAPEPTVLLTLAVLLAHRPEPHALPGHRPGPLAPALSARRLSWFVPLAWCACSAATLATLGAWQALVPLAALALTAWAVAPKSAAHRSR